VTGYGPPDDPSEAPTGQYNYSDYGQQQREPESTPWHRKPAVLIGLGVVAAILIALVIFGILELTKGGGSTSPATSSTTPAVTTTTTSPTTTPSPSSATTTEPVGPAPTTTLTTTPPTSTSIDDGHHHHHHHDDGMP
jgi:cytoskeletal protein RodZ